MPGDVIYPNETNINLGQTMGIFNSFGAIVFAFSFSMILIEIQVMALKIFRCCLHLDLNLN